MSRVLCWFSCGAASALASKLAIKKYGGRCEIAYCASTLSSEHPDNLRFLRDVSMWLNRPINMLFSKDYKDIYDVYDKTGWLVGPDGARCTAELKKIVRRKHQREDDIHVFGLTADEQIRIDRFPIGEPDLTCDWILRDQGVTKSDCYRAIREAGIEMPAMYLLGYKNNNCIGCVKGQMGYWNKIRVDFPQQFDRMAKQERKMGVAICKSYAGDGLRKKVFLDELDPTAGRFDAEPDIECGVVCVWTQTKLELEPT